MFLLRNGKALPLEKASGKTGNLHGKSEGLSDETDGSHKGSSPTLLRGKWTGSLEKGRGINQEGPQKSENKAMLHAE